MAKCKKCGGELEMISRIRASCSKCGQRYVQLDTGWMMEGGSRDEDLI